MVSIEAIAMRLFQIKGRFLIYNNLLRINAMC
jgi:hypothetical protein